MNQEQQEPKTVSINVEIPEDLYNARQKFIEADPSWSAERFEQAATSLFLLQNGKDVGGEVSQAYLNSLFGAAS